ncbi:unannotated protein [freshwater metagenome]|uniref:Unannotated protein n=1 Tax=freshwater metagenome TaxID=449393 RepID=A0A6J7EJR5_9ZZZZ
MVELLAGALLAVAVVAVVDLAAKNRLDPMLVAS